MSSSVIEVDFNTLKYNLYDILQVEPTASDNQIKKTFIKAIRNFHPDKNSELENEIYYHLVLSNQILLNPVTRSKYDAWLLSTAQTFDELKSSFKKTATNIDNYFPKKEVSNGSFKSKMEELNKKHGYDESLNSVSINERFAKVKSSRTPIEIQREDIRGNSDFNEKFNSGKETGKLKDQIIEWKPKSTELATWSGNDFYTNLADLDKLYVEDTVLTNKFSSLDRAFILQPVVKETEENKTMEDRMREYKNASEGFKQMKPSEFKVSSKFDSWT
jgi:curved DNA-binding protein CbpA